MRRVTWFPIPRSSTWFVNALPVSAAVASSSMDSRARLSKLQHSANLLAAERLALTAVY
jgi:hypothetical protein